MAEAMGIPHNAIHLAFRRGRVTVAMLYTASKASGLTIDDLLSGPVPANRCHACGQIKRRVA